MGNTQEIRRSDPRPTEELIHIALTEPDENVAWDAVTILQYRGSQDVLETARKLCGSGSHRERRVGADILGQLGIPDRTFPDECVEILIGMLAGEEHTGVLSAIGIALGHLHDVRAVQPLIEFKNHPCAEVRGGVVFGLLGLEDELAIRTLIELTEDVNDRVRDWATFGIGSQIDTDTNEIREVLARRLDDTDDQTRHEAIMGLARRRDARVVDLLEVELSLDDVQAWAIEAAGYAADPRLSPALIRLRVRRWGADNHFDFLLEEAIGLCGEVGE